MSAWQQVVWLSLGGSLGVNARYWLGAAISRWAGPGFPWATLTINATGSFAIGLLTVLLSRWLPHPQWRLMVVVGFLGGYTTFSSFAAEAMVLWEGGARAAGAGYVAGSVAAGLAAVVLGAALGRGLIEASGRWSARDGRGPDVASARTTTRDGATAGREASP